MTQFQLHCERWKAGCGNEICGLGRKRCFSRGRIPCDVLFVGEAPGKSENVHGKPFVGPAGHVLDDIIVRSLGRFASPDPADPNRLVPMFTFAVTNVVACMPELDESLKPEEPTSEQVAACAPRLQEYVRIADPKLVVAVGAVARGYVIPGYRSSIKFHRKIPTVDIVHPAAILKANIAARGLMVQKAALTVRGALEDLIAHSQGGNHGTRPQNVRIGR